MGMQGSADYRRGGMALKHTTFMCTVATAQWMPARFPRKDQDHDRR